MEFNQKLEKIESLIEQSKKKKSKKEEREERELRYKTWEIKTVKKGMDNPNLGVYIHIPFCSRKCDYCDFVSYSMDEEAQRKYLDCLKIEIETLAPKFVNKTFDTLYIGGGTPSIVFDGFIRELSREVFSHFHFLPGFEFTIEINPSSVTEEKLFEYMKSGVNRISMGVQCLDSKLLHNLGRIQSIENIDNAFKLLHKMQYINIGSDVMIGLPDQTLSSVKDTIEYLIKQNVKHISVYTLQIENHTLLFDRVQQGKVKPLSDEMCIKMYNMVYDMLKKAGYVRYEVSNFAKPSFESKHNFKYWNEVEYLGLGVSAHSYMDNYRFSNTKRLDTYIETIEGGHLPIDSKEYLNFEERKTERIMLSLRLASGLDLDEFKKEFHEDLLKTKKDVIDNLIEMDLVKIEDGYLKLTEDSFYVSNKIILELL